MVRLLTEEIGEVGIVSSIARNETTLANVNYNEWLVRKTKYHSRGQNQRGQEHAL